MIYNAWQHFEAIPVAVDVLEKFQVTEKSYIFALGSLEPNKNLKWILNAAKNNPQETFIVGGGINEAVFAKQNFSLPPNVRLIGYLSDVESKSLMHYCKAFVFPSFYEGFGIPPMEAMVAGAPQIFVSDIPVMHEIFGNEVEYIDPQGEGNGLKCEPHGNYSCTLLKYTWSDSAQKLMRCLRRIEEKYDR